MAMRVVLVACALASVSGKMLLAGQQDPCANIKCAPSLTCTPPFTVRPASESGGCCATCWSDEIKVPEDRSWTKTLTGGIGQDNNADPVKCRGVMCPPLHCIETEQFFDGRCCTKCNTAEAQTAADLAKGYR